MLLAKSRIAQHQALRCGQAGDRLKRTQIQAVVPVATCLRAALGRRAAIGPPAVPSRITQPRGGGPELDLVLHNIPRRRGSSQSNDVALV